MPDLTIKQDDTFPVLTATLSDADGPVDLTSSESIKVFLVSGGLSVTGTCLKDADQTTNPGKLTYPWVAANTATVGLYNGEFQVTWNASQIQTFPNDGYFEVEIVADLGD